MAKKYCGYSEGDYLYFYYNGGKHEGSVAKDYDFDVSPGEIPVVLCSEGVVVHIPRDDVIKKI